jgi:DNA replication protein DnaC
MTQQTMQNHSATEMLLSSNQIEVQDYFKQESKKGLLLFGPTGTGKTTAMETYKAGKWAGSAIEIANLVSQKGRSYLEKYKIHDMIVDDLGREPKTVKSYGDEILVMHDLICIRYDAFVNGYKTHFTTNLTFSEIAERYGEAVADRIKEMTDVIVFCGESYRK